MWRILKIQKWYDNLETEYEVKKIHGVPHVAQWVKNPR